MSSAGAWLVVRPSLLSKNTLLPDPEVIRKPLFAVAPSHASTALVTSAVIHVSPELTVRPVTTALPAAGALLPFTAPSLHELAAIKMLIVPAVATLPA
jgi:hypothetical protein